ncbi:MAG TPA: pyridoxal-dependent decarboxylase [Spirochaetota bacterium]|nr:pyridoxal-dependent decarboxylase [Spirochaetota bacterium]
MIDKLDADIEHLRKLFVFPESQDRFLEFGKQILDMMYNSFKQKGGLHSSITLDELSSLFSDISIPRDPKLLRDIFPEIQNKIAAHSVKVYSPYYIGHMTSAIPYFTILIEMIVSSLNQNQVKIETAKASTYVERELLCWIHRLIYRKNPRFYKETIQNHRVALGNVTSDGTMANLTAMLVARNLLFKEDGRFPGIASAGLAEAYNHYNCEKTVLLMSKRGHYSFDKIADLCGIGDNNIIKIPVENGTNKIDINVLSKELNSIEDYNKNHEKKIKILSLIGIAGTTETGNIDNLYEMNKLAKKHKTRFHVDAAWGGPVLFVEDYAHLFKGIEEADSVTFDSHKLLYLPLSMGMVLFNSEKDLQSLEHTTQYVVRRDSRDQGRFTIEGSRPFAALRPWVALKVIGSEGFRLLFEKAFTISSYFKTQIDLHSNFESLNEPELFIFNYRFIPNRIKKHLESLMAEKSEASLKQATRINNELNALNIQLHREIRNNDLSFVSRTVIESTKYSPDEIVVLRAVTINPLTTNSIIKEIIAEHNRLGLRIFNKSWKKKFKNIT